ncbi:MAG TPA: VanW family protein [Bacillota bacterium]|nr:VanW family protein [Bacillota bacterium]
MGKVFLSNKKWLLYGVVAPLVVIGLSLGGMYSYANQPTIPPGLTLEKWKVGGLSKEALHAEWEKKKEGLLGESIEFTLPSGEKRIMLVKDLPVKMDDEKALNAVLSYGHEGNFVSRAWKRWKARKGIDYTLALTWDEPGIKNKFEQTWADLLHHEPKDAKWSITDKDEVQFEPDQSATNLDLEQLSKQLTAISMVTLMEEKSVTIPLPMVDTKAHITLDDLKKSGIERKVAEFSTNYVANAGGRTHNVEATAKTLDNVLLKPGEVFDYSKIIKDTETKYGYQPAPEIVQGRLEMGIGGGICQVSSTLYNAVLLSNLDIVERQHHSLPVGYIPLGRDATYSDDTINFKFKNSTPNDILIKTVALNGKLTIKMFGSAPANREIEITSQTVSVLEPSTKVVTDSSLAQGERRVVSSGRTGYKVEVYKIVKENGQVKDKILVSTDIYEPQSAIVHVGS